MSRGLVLVGVGLVALAAVLSLTVPWAGPAMGWPDFWGSSPATPVTLDAAAELVRRVLAEWGYPDLVPKEVMEFTNHFYVLVVEKDTGKGAMELIVERNGFVHPEPGPNMMWNTKYGHMAGMMGPASGIWLGAPTLFRERAREIAREFLERVYPGAEPDHGTEFYGYFTFDVERGGKTFGMLSVNAYTGQVWYHAWHGAFIREKEL
ncbi:MAG: hypothetical protein QN213_06855 [Armatimonadota bacterium]|nr:hypothetical protein [Armatimonadota bacterium]MDR7386528.1 hypothetical protein [Armatimonadota bacterium]MDR7388789.1 hypothetical protein [Armatimonadota bacterium]MDR7395255.1 hypothetical protein [Armatimonadota bacterium]MDR7396194.1 hypothetical protein [Armatimonadota bacterium]